MLHFLENFYNLQNVFNIVLVHTCILSYVCIFCCFIAPFFWNVLWSQSLVEKKDCGQTSCKLTDKLQKSNQRVFFCEIVEQRFPTKAQKKSELHTTHSTFNFQPKISISRKNRICTIEVFLMNK